MKNGAIKIGLVVIFFTLASVRLAYCQSEALKVVTNELAFYKQKKDLKYLGMAQKSIDSLFRVSPDSLDLERNVYRAVVYSTILFADTANKLKEPDPFFPQTAYLVDRLIERRPIQRYRQEINYSRRCVVNVYLRHGFDYLERADYRKALGAFNDARRFNSDFKPLESYIAWTNAKLGKFQEAAQYYTTLAGADSTSASYAEAASNIYKSLGDTTAAIKIVKEARQRFPADRSLLLDEANMYNNRGDYTGLSTLVPDLLDIYPDNADIAFIAANCYDHLNKTEQAKTLYIQSIELNNVSFGPVFNLGLLYLKQSITAGNDKKQDNQKQAEEWLKKANEISPYDVHCLKALRLLYAQTGNQTQINRVDNELKQLTN